MKDIVVKLRLEQPRDNKGRFLPPVGKLKKFSFIRKISLQQAGHIIQFLGLVNDQ